MGLAHTLEALKRSAYRVVKINDDLEFKVKRISSADLAVHGTSVLMQVLKPEDASRFPGLSESDAHTLLLERYKQLPKSSIASMAHSEDCMVMAGVVAARSPGSSWEPLRVVSDQDTSVPDGTAVVLIDDLPSSTRKLLATQVAEHSRDEEGLALALAGFRASTAPID
tara:strand:- start:78 stop:581 length:504 start_codon:yes stop_codon:yes gene_type:complete